MAEKTYPEEVAALQPDTTDSNKQKGHEAAWEVLLKHDKDLAAKLVEATSWTREQLPSKLDNLRKRLANPLYSKSLGIIQESQDNVQLLQLKDVTDEKDVVAIQCLCTNLWFVGFFEMSVETYDRYMRALGRTST